MSEQGMPPLPAPDRRALRTLAHSDAQMHAYGRQVAEECARLCDAAKPDGGRAWSLEQGACFDALTHVEGAIRKRFGLDKP